MPRRRGWAGIDVGGPRKGFDLAFLRETTIEGPVNRKLVEEAIAWLRDRKPAVIAIDSPRCAAPEGARSREGERLLARADICGIRWTPDEVSLRQSRYYDWILRGLKLYRALEGEAARWGGEVIEVFPTASWTKWAGKRRKERRAAWTANALAGLGLQGLPSRRLNQDDRDAIAAALTARLYSEGAYRAFGDIIVPTARP